MGWIWKTITKFASSKPAAAPSKKELYSWASIDTNLKNMNFLPDPDAVLKRLKKSRQDLQVLLTDPDIDQAVQTRLDALIATPFRLDPSEGELPEFIWDNLNRIMPKIIECCFEARLYGFSVAERVYEYDANGRIVLKDVRACDLKNFRFTPEDELEMLYDGDWGKIDLVSKYLLVRCSPRVSNPYGKALLSTLYWSWAFKTDIRRFMVMFMERASIPMLVGKAEKNVNAMAVAIKKAFQDAVLAISNKDSVEMLQPPAAGGSNNFYFKVVNDMFVDEILVLVLGQTLTSKVGSSGGNRALGEVQDRVRMDKRNSDVRLITPAAQNVVNALTWLNFSLDTEPPTASFGDDTGLETDRASRDVSFLNTGEIQFTRKYYVDKYDFSDEHFFLRGEEGYASKTSTEVIEVDDLDDGGRAPAKKENEDAVSEEEIQVKNEKAAKLALAIKILDYASENSRYTRDERKLEEMVVELAAQPGVDLDPDQMMDVIMSSVDGQQIVDNLVSEFSAANLENRGLIDLFIDAQMFGNAL